MRCCRCLFVVVCSMLSFAVVVRCCRSLLAVVRCCLSLFCGVCCCSLLFCGVRCCCRLLWCCGPVLLLVVGVVRGWLFVVCLWLVLFVVVCCYVIYVASCSLVSLVAVVLLFGVCRVFACGSLFVVRRLLYVDFGVGYGCSLLFGVVRCCGLLVVVGCVALSRVVGYLLLCVAMCCSLFAVGC